MTPLFIIIWMQLDVSQLIQDQKFGYKYGTEGAIDMLDNEFVNIRVQYEVENDWNDIIYEDIGF